MNEKNLLKEKTFEGLYVFLRQLAAQVEDSVKLIEVCYSLCFDPYLIHIRLPIAMVFWALTPMKR